MLPDARQLPPDGEPRDAAAVVARPQSLYGDLVNTRPFTFLMLALALILAPLGLCLDHGAAVAAPVHASAMQHGGSEAAADHSGHGDAGDAGQSHFCAECRPDTFLKAGAGAAPDASAASPAFALLPALPETVAPRRATLTFARGLSPPPPPRSRRYRIRLQI